MGTYFAVAGVVALVIIVGRLEAKAPRSSEGPVCTHCGSAQLTSSLRRPRCLDCGHVSEAKRRAQLSTPPRAFG
jgi:hypothetical protein